MFLCVWCTFAIYVEAAVIDPMIINLTEYTVFSFHFSLLYVYYYITLYIYNILAIRSPLLQYFVRDILCYYVMCYRRTHHMYYIFLRIYHSYESLCGLRCTVVLQCCSVVSNPRSRINPQL